MPNSTIDFGYVPIGYVNFISRPLELCNISMTKVKYVIPIDPISDFNKQNDNFEIFQVENTEGSIGPGESKFMIASFKPLTEKSYDVYLSVIYTDELVTSTKKVHITGKGFHPLKFSPPPQISPFAILAHLFLV